MVRTLEAVIEEGGKVRLLEPVDIQVARRALVTVLDEEPRGLDVASEPSDVTRLSEPALAQDWNRPEEDAAWSHLQLIR